MTSTVSQEQWLADWHDWHAAREQAVLAPHGIAANTGTTWLSDEPQAVPGLAGEWVGRDGLAVKTRSDLTLKPGQEHHSGDKLVKVITPRPDTVAVRVYDPAAPTRTGLAGIATFTPVQHWVVPAHFEPADPDSTIAITHVDGVTTKDALSGRVRAELDGQQFELVAWPSSETGFLELTFADTTNGVSTDRFRFLKFAAPDSGDAVELDFNRSHLPQCAFGEGYLCPIPPAENRLPFAVEAGERSPLRQD